ncbi:hypothetical protein CLLI_17850 [Clostridium liquoris]|jgi:hypothetical protein|uniref:Uncharacterized protein n=1 Tax=Clostridium liquoris TaxID=1289519 RepID=A0A2T0B387_9CLOT|nr:hypothetical protein [Clostridium liquoris]PRR78358.1 hypothetical protein CLLI_17850 [Clostridium liquoris]
MSWLYFVKLLIFSFIVIIIYNLLKVFVLSKYKPNKWVIFAIAIAILTTPTMVKPGFNTTAGGMVVSGIFVVLILWFIDLFNDDRLAMKNKKNDVKIKPKAKPNRVKNNKDTEKKK